MVHTTEVSEWPKKVTEFVWESTLHESESQLLTNDLPIAAPLGTCVVDNGRTWQRVEIISGRAGARWAYWAPWRNEAVHQPGVGPHPQFKVVLDSIFNSSATHFVGMLAVPYAGHAPGQSAMSTGTLVWVITHPIAPPPPPVYVREEKQTVRYERSDEVYDVETKQLTQVRKNAAGHDMQPYE